METINDVIFEIDLQGNLLYLSPSVERVTDYKVKDLIGKNFLDFVDDKDKERVISTFSRTNDFIRSLEYRFKVSKDRIMWTRVNSKLVFRDGVPMGRVGVVYDISEYKEATEQLAKSEEKFRHLVENIHDVLYEVDETGTVMYVSPSVENIFGYSPEELISLNIVELLFPEDKAYIAELLSTFGTRETVYPEFRLFDKKGEVRWVRASATPIFQDGVLLGGTGSLVDITQRKKAEIALQESERNYKEAQELAKMGHWELDLVNNKLKWADETYRLFGVKPGRFGENYDAFLEFIHPDDRDMLNKAFQKSLEQKTLYDFVHRTVPEKGRVKYINERCRIEYDKRGKPVRAIGTAMDVTERYLYEEKLRKLQRAVEQSPVSIVMTDLDGNIEYANPKMCEVTGYDLSELVGQNPRVLKSGDTPESEYDYLWKSIVGGNVWRGVFHNKRKDGSLYWESAFITPVLDAQGKVMSYLGIKEDITEQKSVQEALAKSEDRFRQVAQQSRTVVWEVDSKGIYTYVNSVAEDVWGFHQDEILGKYYYELHPKENRQEFIQSTQKYFKKKIPFENLLNPVETKQGHKIWVMTSGVPMVDSNGKLLGYQGSDRDVTEQIDAEQRVRESEDALNQAQEIANMGSWEYDFATDQVVWSKNMYRMLGVEQGEMEIKVETINQFIHPDDLPEHKKIVDRILKTGEVLHSEFRFLFKDKTIKWVHNVIAPFYENKKLIKLRGIALDITNKKQQEEELIEKNVRLSAIMNATPDLVFVYDKQGVCREYYSVAGKKTALSEENIIGSKLTDIYNKEDAAFHLQKINQAIKKKTLVTYEYQMNINGKQNFFEARVKALDEKHVLIFSTDITERKQAEQEIKELNSSLEQKVVERTRQLEDVNQMLKAEVEERKMAEKKIVAQSVRLGYIIEGASLGTWEWNVQTGEVKFNKELVQMLGYTLDELSPVTVNTWNDRIHPDDLKMSNELLQKHFSGQIDFYDIEFRMKQKSGQWIWVQDHGKVIDWTSDGKPMWMFGILQNITERKRSELFEKELLQLSPKLTGVGLSEVDNALNYALNRISYLLDSDRSSIVEFDPEIQFMSNTYEWCASGIESVMDLIQRISCNGYSEFIQLLYDNENIVIPSVSELPDSWSAEKKMMRMLKIESVAIFPLQLEDKLVGFVVLASLKKKKEFSDAELNSLKIWGSMVSSLISHKRAEIQLEQSRKNHKLLFDTMEDLLFVFREEGTIIHVNAAVERRLNYSMEELIGESVLKVKPKSRWNEIMNIVNNLPPEETQSCTIPLVKKSGELIPVETRIKRGNWDGEPIIFCLSKDISMIKLSEEKFSKAFHSTSTMMAICSFENANYIDVNSAFLETLGYTNDELIGKTSKDINLFKDENFRDTIVRMIENKMPVNNIEVEFRDKNGSLKYGLLSAESIYLGEERCLLTVTTDITERKKAENEIRKARLEAEEANKAKSDFLSRMSHELRTPMNSILGFAQLLEMSKLDERQKKGVHHIAKSGKHLLELINEVLDIARIEAGRISLSLEPVRVREAIEEMLEVVKQQAEEKQISIEVVQNTNEEPVFIQADKQRLHQVILNLLNNAVKYNKEGGNISITTIVEPSDIEGENNVRITITDTGIGISKKDLPKLFNPFERIGAEKTNVEGTGLGLSVVKRLMEAMGGEYGAQSVLHKGSTFWVEFSMTKGHHKQVAQQTATSKGKEEQAISGTLLYIEDNFSNIELVDQILSSQRPNLHLVTDAYGKNTLKLALEYKPDIILLDLNLPDVYGKNVLEMLKKNKNTETIPVVVISADALPQQIEALMQTGAAHYLTKPLEVESFLNVIDHILKPKNSSSL